jgi:hypothetical protein
MFSKMIGYALLISVLSAAYGSESQLVPGVQSVKLDTYLVESIELLGEHSIEEGYNRRTYEKQRKIQLQQSTYRKEITTYLIVAIITIGTGLALKWCGMEQPETGLVA